MLVVGPSIFQLSDPTIEHVSAFTQTMDKLLPEPQPYIGTMIGVAVLMSASAASAQGLQNLVLGLNHRNYIHHLIAQRVVESTDIPVFMIPVPQEVDVTEVNIIPELLISISK